MLYKNPFEGYPEIEKLRDAYEKKFSKRAPGINYDQFESMNQYKEYLLKAFEKEQKILDNRKSKCFCNIKN